MSQRHHQHFLDANMSRDESLTFQNDQNFKRVIIHFKNAPSDSFTKDLFQNPVRYYNTLKNTSICKVTLVQGHLVVIFLRGTGRFCLQDAVC